MSTVDWMWGVTQLLQEQLLELLPEYVIKNNRLSLTLSRRDKHDCAMVLVYDLSIRLIMIADGATNDPCTIYHHDPEMVQKIVRWVRSYE